MLPPAYILGMAIRLRTISNKLTPIKNFVSQGKHLTLARSEGRHPFQSSKSHFLEEFLTPSCVNSDDRNIGKQMDGKSCVFNHHRSEYVGAVEDWNSGMSGASVHVGLYRFEDEFLRNDMFSNIEQFLLDHRPMSVAFDAERPLHCFDPLSVAVKSYVVTSDDILWNSDISRDTINKNDVSSPLINFTGLTSKGDTHAVLSEYGRESSVLAGNNGEIAHAPNRGFPKPTEDQLRKIYTVLGDTLPNLFVKPLDYSIYHEDIIFEDNIQGRRTEGLTSYVKQMTLLNIIGHLKFVFVNFGVLKITMHPEDGTVKVRWRIVGLSALKIMVTIWKYKIWKVKDMFETQEAWYDGFSTFYVGGDGLIYKHVADKMMPDDDRVPDVKNPPLVAKLALLVAASSRQGLTGLDSVLTFLSSSLKLHCISSIKLPVSKLG